jgi:hypothetical protein
MRKHKEAVEDESNDAHLFDVLDASDDGDDSEDDPGGSERKPPRPARQRVELRHEQQSLKRQLSDWDDYEQDGFDTKL